MRRRTFLQGTAAAGAAALGGGAAPAFPYLRRRFEPRRPVVGSGEHRYQLVVEWVETGRGTLLGRLA